MPSVPTTETAAAQAAADVICWHSASGATTRSTRCELDGCAAGMISKPSEVGTNRASSVWHKNDDNDEDGEEEAVLPAVHEAHSPEHALVARPAWSPKVPGGHSEHVGAPASEYVPGLHKTHEVMPGCPHVPAGHGVHPPDAEPR